MNMNKETGCKSSKRKRTRYGEGLPSIFIMPSPCVVVNDLRKEFTDIPDFYFIHDTAKSQKSADELIEKTFGTNALNLVMSDCNEDNIAFSEDFLTFEAVLMNVPKRTEEEGKLKTLDVLTMSDTIDTGLMKSSYMPRRLYPSYEIGHIFTDSDNERILDEVVVSFFIYDCAKNDTEILLDRLVVRQKLDLLSSQTLLDLKNAIKCPEDMLTNISYSSDDVQSSSFFFFGNTFYSEKSDDKSHQTSLDWCKSHVDLFPYENFEERLMSDVVIGDLNIQFGMPYIYKHVGFCEHVIIVTNAVLSNRNYDQNITHYPILSGCSKGKCTKCCICDRLEKKWIARNAPDLLPSDPAPLCDVCAKLLFFDKDGNKISGEFMLYRSSNL